MDFKVFLSQEALDDLEGIVAYVAPHNSQAAEQMGNLLLKSSFSLDVNPERGRIIPEFRRANVREMVVCPYRIIYRVRHDDMSVEIVRFWHGVRDFPLIS